MMTKIEIAKNAASIVIGAGTSRIVGGIIANNVQPDKTIDKVTVPAASVVIGMMAADKTKAYTDNLIDEAIAWWKTNVKK